MNENAKKWVAALRSGEYEHGFGRLRTPDGHYCCLGVACDLYGKSHGISWDSDSGFLGEDMVFPTLVQEWIGLASCKGSYGLYCLTERNDFGCSFSEIADIIESEPEGLFR